MKEAAENRNFSPFYFQSTPPALHVSAPAAARTTAHVHRGHGTKGDYENWLGINCRYYKERDSSYLRRGKGGGKVEARRIHLTIKETSVSSFSCFRGYFLFFEVNWLFFLVNSFPDGGDESE